MNQKWFVPFLGALFEMRVVVVVVGVRVVVVVGVGVGYGILTKLWPLKKLHLIRCHTSK